MEGNKWKVKRDCHTYNIYLRIRAGILGDLSPR